MKLRKILAGFLAGAVAMSSMVFTSVTASAETGDALYTLDTPTSTNYWCGFTVTADQLATLLGDPEYIVSAINSVTVNYTATGEGEMTFSYNTDEANSYYINGTDTTNITAGDGSYTLAYPCAYETGGDFSFYIGGVDVKVNSIKYNCTYSSESISAANFTYSELSNETLNVGDTITITYNSEKTPAAAQHMLKYAYAYTLEDTSDASYFTVVNGDGTIDNSLAETVGVTATKETSGTITTYTFTATSPSASKFKINVEISPNGTWADNDHLYPWFGTVSYKVVPVEIESITVTPDVASIKIGETLQLEAEVLPANATDKTVTWISDDEDIVTVDKNGLVTAVGEGTISVTATAGEESASCTITVLPADAETIPVTGISIDKSTLKLEVGEEGTITAEVLPANATDKTVTWTSSDTTVATVADGVVTAIKEGEATITAKAGEYSTTCKVTVAAASGEGEVDPEPEEPTDSGFDKTIAEFSADDAGKIVAQTAVFEGKTAMRFTKMVKKSDLNNAGYAIFTLNNGTATKTYTSDKYYTQLSASNTTVKVPSNEYVFLSLTVIDIPDGVTVKCTDISLKYGE